MMRWYLATACAAGCVAMGMAQSAKPFDTWVDDQIRRFQSPWTPASGVLDGVTVIIEPRPLDDQPQMSQPCVHHSLLVAEHLRHLVSFADGRPLLTRPVEHRETVSLNALAAGMTKRDAQAIILVRYDDASEGESPPRVRLEMLLDNDAGRRFGECLIALTRAADLDVEIADASRSMTGLRDQPQTLVVSATFAAAITESSPPEHVRNARWLFEALAASQQHFVRERPPADASTSLAPARRRAKRIWPFGDLPLERAEWFCDQFAEGGVRADSLIYFTPQARVSDGVVVLEGATSVPALKQGLAAALTAVGVAKIDNRMRIVPDDANHGDERFGVCRVESVLTYKRPKAAGGLQTELVRGEAVMLLDATQTDYLVLADDGYWGWCPHAAIETCAAAAFDRAVNAPSKAAASPPPAEAIVRAALELLYAPYVFGGKTALGIDCSGMICTATRSVGRVTARDAWQQSLSGRLVATRWHRSAIQPGDRLYFINDEGHIYHTALAISPTHYVHASAPYVQINSLTPGERLYNASLDRHFFVAKRP